MSWQGRFFLSASPVAHHADDRRGRARQRQSTPSTSSGLTPHAIYERDAPGVVFVKADVIQPVEDPFDLYPPRRQSPSTGSGFLISRSDHQ